MVKRRMLLNVFRLRVRAQGIDSINGKVVGVHTSTLDARRARMREKGEREKMKNQIFCINVNCNEVTASMKTYSRLSDRLSAELQSAREANS